MRFVGALLGLLLLAGCGESEGSSSGASAGSAGSGVNAGTGGSSGSAGSSANAGSSGSGGSSSSEPFGAEFEGVYTLDEITMNTDSCDVEGESARSVIPDTHLVMKSYLLAGVPYLGVRSCSGIDACRTLADSIETSAPSAGDLSYLFAEQQATTMLGQWIYQGQLQDGTCIHRGVMDNVLSKEGALATIEQRGRFGDYPADPQDGCAIAGAAEQVAAVPCAELRVLTATFVEAL